MSITAAGLQRQLDALQQFCHQRQLSVNLAKVVPRVGGAWVSGTLHLCGYTIFLHTCSSTHVYLVVGLY